MESVITMPVEFRLECFKMMRDISFTNAWYWNDGVALSVDEKKSLRAYSILHGSDTEMLSPVQLEVFMRECVSDLLDDDGNVLSVSMPSLMVGEKELRDSLSGGMWDTWLHRACSEYCAYHACESRNVMVTSLNVDYACRELASVWRFSDIARILRGVDLCQIDGIASALDALCSLDSSRVNAACESLDVPVNEWWVDYNSVAVPVGDSSVLLDIP